MNPQNLRFKNLRNAFVNAIKEVPINFEISTSPEIHPSYRPDLVFSYNGTKIMVELISSTYPQKIIELIYQLIGYDRISPHGFDIILVIIPKNSLKSSKLQDIIDRTQRELSKIQVFTYHVEEKKIVFNQLTDLSGPLPRTFFSELRPSFTVKNKKSQIQLSYPKSMRVVKYLLTNKKATQTEISKQANVSIGLVNKIVTYLIENDIVQYRKKTFVLLEPWKLLNQIAWSRNMEMLRTVKYSVSDRFSNIEEVEKQFSQILKNNGIRYAFTLFSAAKLYSPYIKKYDVLQLYAESLGDSLKKVIKKELEPTTKGQLQLEIFEPDSIDIFGESSMFDGFRVCSKIQTVIDLYCYGNIGREFAIDLYSRM